MTRRLVAAAAALGLALAFACGSGKAEPTYDKRAAAAERRAAIETGKLKARLDAEQAERVRIWNDAVLWNQVKAGNDAVYWNQIAAYAAAVERAQAEEAARAEAARRAAAPAPAPAPSGGGGGSCYGGVPLSDTLVTNESGGRADARNPSSSAWGCFQILDTTWNGLCSDLGSHGSAGVEAQKECARRIWNEQGRGAWEAAG